VSLCFFKAASTCICISLIVPALVGAIVSLTASIVAAVTGIVTIAESQL
jgi:hypothetical protein